MTAAPLRTVVSRETVEGGSFGLVRLVLACGHVETETVNSHGYAPVRASARKLRCVKCRDQINLGRVPA